MIPEIRPEWAEVLAEAFAQPSMKALAGFLQTREEAGTEIFPPSSQIFAALDAVPPSAVRCVILGQDPYPTPGNAHGFAFSVQHGVKIPASLANIYRELESDIECRSPEHGNLKAWAQQGVLLLNTLLTVEKGQPLSHKKKGWEPFTDAIIRHLGVSSRPIVFMLWGGQAQRKGPMIDTNIHLVINTPHPSPLAAHTGWFGSKPFSRANAFLEKCGRGTINWSVD